MEPPPPMSLFSGSTRKQNVACDACRSKKIRCQRVTTAQRCGQCAAKGLECTSNYIEQLQNKPRRPRRFKSSGGDKEQERRSDDDGRPSPPRLPSGSGTSGMPSDDGFRGTRPSTGGSGSASVLNGTTGITTIATDGRQEPLIAPPPVDDPLSVFAWMAQPSVTVFKKRDAAALQADLLRYLFCPVPVLHQEWRYSDVWGIEQARSRVCDLWEEMGGNVWDEAPTAAHLAFWGGAESDLENLSIELIDSFFTIVEPRIPILDAHQFLARFQAPNTNPLGPLPHSLLAVVLAFGARFADHTVFQTDRDECTARDADNGGRTRSRLMQLLVVRAREVAEMNKAYRTPTLANAQTLLLLEGLLCQSITLRTNYRLSNIWTAARHLDHLRDPSLMQVTAEKDEKTRTQLALHIMSSVESAFFRIKPDSWIVELNGTGGGGIGNLFEGAPLVVDSNMEDLWLVAARTGAGIIKRLSHDLWIPRVQANGIALNVLRDFVHDHSAWRDLYLGKLGMPATFPSDLDFASTMKAATTDIFFHGMWLVVERAVRDFGINETDDSSRHLLGFEMQQMKDRLSQEAVHSAMRITMLAALTAEQGLLRLDPLILYRPIYDAGMFLARRGQDEALGCVAGLKQYSSAYPQVWDLAAEIEATLGKARGPPTPPASIGTLVLNHVTSLAA